MENKKKLKWFVDSHIKLKTILTKNLKPEEKLSICKLKNSFWKWTIKNQLNWFKVNVKKNDTNNLMFLNNKIIGYTLLRKRKFKINLKKANYLYLDTFLINKNFRNLGLGIMLIKFNNKIIRKFKRHSFLICPKKITSFYLKNGWKKLDKNSYKITDHKSKWHNKNNPAVGMTYNYYKKPKKIVNYYLNS